MAEVLLLAKPDLKIRNRFGGVSIIPASERGHVDYIRHLDYLLVSPAAIAQDGCRPFRIWKVGTDRGRNGIRPASGDQICNSYCRR
jgi:hypothetical protein